MQIALIVLSAILLLAVAALGVKLHRLNSRFAGVTDLEKEIARLKSDLDRDARHFDQAVAKNKNTMDGLDREYRAARSTYDRLRNEISVLEESLEDISFGLYRPHFTFEDPAGYKRDLDRIYEKKRALIKDGAMACPKNWTVNGSSREGAKMIKQESKLMLRAFNGEVDAAVANLTWNNELKMEERIKKSYEAINALGSVTQIRINVAYLKVALKQLRLTYELELKKQEAKEEQRQIRAQMREEEIAQREFEKARKAAEAEEARYSKALEVARAEMEKAKESEMAGIAEKISKLHARLAEAQDKLARAVSLAQLTKSGHVYVISNIGSFGDDVFKIGKCIHAMIFS